MADAILAIAVSVFIFSMATCAAVLLVALFAGRQSRGRKVLIAAAGGPGSFFALLIPFMALEEPELLPILAVLGGGTLLAGVVIGWPIAYFATRRLERLTRFDASSFE